MTLDGDWECTDGTIDDPCYAVWISCEDCRGNGMPCPICFGTGGGYICGYHDIDHKTSNPNCPTAPESEKCTR